MIECNKAPVLKSHFTNLKTVLKQAWDKIREVAGSVKRA